MSERRQDSAAMRSELYGTTVVLLVSLILVAITADATTPSWLHYVVWAVLIALLFLYVAKVVLIRR